MNKVITYILILISIIATTSCKNENVYSVCESYELKTKKGFEYNLEVNIPSSYGLQKIEDIKISGVDEQELVSDENFEIIKSKIRGNGKVINVTIEYSVTINKSINTWTNPVNKTFLEQSEFLDINHPSIKTLANDLKGSTDYKTAKNISEYVSKNIQWIKVNRANKKLRKASKILEEKNGVCRDFAALSVALLRSSGIPSKEISGLSLKSLKKTGPWSSSGAAHAWVEFYVDNYWHFDDPSWSFLFLENFYFDNPDTYHLSYGHGATYSTQIEDLRKTGYKVFSMTNPISFIAWTKDEDAIITPTVYIE